MSPIDDALSIYAVLQADLIFRLTHPPKSCNMKLLSGFVLPLFHLASAVAAASWTFEDATLTIQGKGAGVGGGAKEQLSPSSPLTKPLTLTPSDTLKLALTTKDGKSGARPHQAFLTFRETVTGLEESFALNVKESGKAKLEVSQKDLPYQLLTSSQPLKVSMVLASFGSSTPLNQNVFDLDVQPDANLPPTAPPSPERYARKPEIHHIFRDDPKSPPKIVSLVFTLAVLATLPILAGAWLFLGGNVEHMSKAFGTSPVAHGLFFGSIMAMEGVFFMYYVSWNLFQTLPAAAIVGTVAFVSGSRALTEVQDRRLGGER